MDYTRIQIDSIGIGLVDYKNVDLTRDGFINSYLAVGEKIPSSAATDTNNLNYYYDFIVAENHIGINATRNQLTTSNKSLLINGDIVCNGIIHAENIMIDSINTASTLAETLNKLSSHLLFYPIRDYLQNNIYTNYNLVLGHSNNANNNLNPLKISRHCDGNINNIQFVIENNDVTNLITTKFSSGIIGNTNEAPMHFITSVGMPIHFNISKDTSDIDNLYLDKTTIPYDRRQLPTYNTTNYPTMVLDVNKSVLINLDKQTEQITYSTYEFDGINKTTIGIETKYPELLVNGTLYANKILIYDYVLKKPVNIDTIFLRNSGLTLNANQINGGYFNQSEFFFTSNLYIGNPINKYKLKVYGDAEITNTTITSNIITSNITISDNFIVEANNDGSVVCDFNRLCNFSSEAIFNDVLTAHVINVNTIDITSSGGLLVDGCNILPLLSAISQSNPQLTTPPTVIQSPTQTSNLNVSGIVNIGEPRLDITNLFNIYKHTSANTSQFQIFLYDGSKSTVTASKAYIGHTNLNDISGQIDNSLVFLTENNSAWNNIYFYSGKKKSNIKNEIPNLAILENSKIGINTLQPVKTLDVNGDIVSTNYYIRQNTNIYNTELPIIYNNYNNLTKLDINIPLITTITNKQKLNVIGGINSYDGYYENSYKLCTFKYFNNSNAWIANANIGIGVSNIDNKITIPLQIKNSSLNQNTINNSVMSFYRANDRSYYSGIEFCDDITNTEIVNKNKWYIYKKHITDDVNFVGPLQIGYIENDYEPVKSCINIYYNSSKYFIDINNNNTYNSYEDYSHHNEIVNITGNVKINGDLDIDGSINISGNYKFKSNNIIFVPNLLTTTINKIYSMGNNNYYIDTILTPNGAYSLASNIHSLASNVYLNINKSYDPSSSINIINATNTSNLASNIYKTTSNISLNINNYNGIITNYDSNLNITRLFTPFFLTYKGSTKINQTSNYYLFNDISKNRYPSDYNIIKTNASNNYIIASNIYNTTSNIYNNISNISNTLINYLNIGVNNFNETSILQSSATTTNDTIIQSYISYPQPLANDIQNILITSGSNLIISQQIHNISSNYYTTLLNFNNEYFPYIYAISSNNMITSSNIYISTSNIYNNDIINTPITNENILKYSHSNMLYADRIYNNVSNITYYINDYYPNYNNNILNTNSYLASTITTSNIARINAISTDKIYINLTLGFQNYITTASNNYIFSSNNSNTVITFNRDEPVSLTPYTKLTIPTGISIIYTDTNSFKEKFMNYNNIATTLLDNYDYINTEIRILNNINKQKSAIAASVFNELISDILILQTYATTNYNDGEFLAKSENLTNKFIVCVNKSYDFANSFKDLASKINDYIGAYIGNSRTIIDILNTCIETTNNILNDCWEISKIIVKYVSISFSMNGIIKENNGLEEIASPPIDTDVIITGNLIKLYPSKSVFIGYDRAWYTNIQNSMSINSPLYVYNDNTNTSLCVFSNRGNTFSTTTGLTTIIANAKIDIKIIDASIYNETNSIIESVSLSLLSIRNRTTIDEPTVNHKLSSIFQIKPTNSATPFFNCYKTYDDINIFNIGSGNFYDPTTNIILKRDNVVHINDSTSTHLLRLTNPSTNPVSIDISQHNNSNNWTLTIDDNFKYKYNSKNIINIHANGILINDDGSDNNTTSLLVNSFDNLPALLLKNNYSTQTQVIKEFDLMTANFNYNYSVFGLKYSLIEPKPDYDVENTTYSINNDINFTNISNEIFNVSANYADTTTFNYSNNIIELLPFIKRYDSNISFTINDKVSKDVSVSLGSTSVNITIIIPSVLNSIYTTNVSLNVSNCILTTNIQEASVDPGDIGVITVNYNTNSSPPIPVIHTIHYNKYSSFIINKITATVSSYSYHLSRNEYLIPSAITSNFLSTITSNVNSNIININNNITYLKSWLSSTSTQFNYNEIDEKIYTTYIFGKKYSLNFAFNITDYYNIPANLPIIQRFIKNNAKLPLIKQKNILGNYHNIYSYTNDYEIYFNDFKLINIDNKGNLKTTGNIETNNIYLQGDIYNKDGISLYDNIISIFNNKSIANFELNTKNIILNASSYNRNNYKGCVLINGGDDLNPVNNNMFQINNFTDTDNFITLNSCTQNSYIHFNSKTVEFSKDVNTIYRIGSKNNIFGIWKRINDPSMDYNKNYYIDTSITSTDIYKNAINISYDSNLFNIYNNGLIYSLAADEANILYRTPITDALPKIYSLTGYTYKYNSAPNAKSYTGLLASEVMAVLPEVVSISPIDGSSNIAYGNIIALLIQSIKDLKYQLDALTPGHLTF